jgi:hypothetical protein
MTKTLLLTVLAGCLDTVTSTSAQSVCTEDNQNCGTAWNLGPYTVGQTCNAAEYYGVSVTYDVGAHCDAYHCWATVEGAGVQIRADCYDYVTVAWCDFTQCSVAADGSYSNCHQVPPPD